ncbi:PepSY-associated TM helix domain-containing protein [Micromonospora zamorensis]|uniref:PepSY-associated TM helix domain-containing protein n=1 Tax=Micromonospora zamorensis TaxID=709883 RepID=UPI00379CFDB6
MERPGDAGPARRLPRLRGLLRHGDQRHAGPSRAGRRPHRARRPHPDRAAAGAGPGDGRAVRGVDERHPDGGGDRADALPGQRRSDHARAAGAVPGRVRAPGRRPRGRPRVRARPPRAGAGRRVGQVLADRPEFGPVPGVLRLPGRRQGAHRRVHDQRALRPELSPCCGRPSSQQQSSEVTARSDFADWPLLAKLSGLGTQAHMGLIFGLVNQILLAALALGLLCVIVWGYRMWWQRRPTRTDRRALAGTPPARGGVRGLPLWALLVGVPVTVAIGWALPLFGLTLLAFSSSTSSWARCPDADDPPRLPPLRHPSEADPRGPVTVVRPPSAWWLATRRPSTSAR